MISRRSVVAGCVAGIAGCANPSEAKFKRYDGPQVTRLQVFKKARRLQLIHNKELLRAYSVELGFSPTDHKIYEGDGRTPEGAYLINRRNPHSKFHLSLGISYPNFRDRAHARSIGKSPGGEIFIHGTPKIELGKSDWTYGCIAVTNAEMEDIYAMVPDNTPIFIYP